ncbi:MAG: hypothetical protein CMQ15_16060 [Gammaproteobacteria bacterium]|jgi:2-keto-4-pentenoate hydratase/2-oxohepta-3-ene-1,7-dioic acid hydratase in catechol pathway|nr:hypothetical protein [Gammaproteobacteria bacterium]MBT73520.1 hypothetical protein [Gammaproteobacteria bacterium]MDP6095695.1 fumarylacetoacetate hydrolase family protein [Gammaproteobacteria bacterium]HJO12351.1 fumarylacetoacetate hydrolase family protein [Gammaproteobacteria bacterium]|tara:strand:+ start:83 stop:259 length:177 start_codon:yes stop_codon:yes gene_type:complete
MIWPVAEIIGELPRYFELRAGDSIFTGTLAGVSTVAAGDHLQTTIERVGELEFDLVAE